MNFLPCPAPTRRPIARAAATVPATARPPAVARRGQWARSGGGVRVGFEGGQSGTSVIIVVGVALETVQALESQMLMRQYKGFLE